MTAPNGVAWAMAVTDRVRQDGSMKNGSPEELDFAYDDDFAIFCGGSKRRHLRRKARITRRRVRGNHGRRSHGK